MFGLTPVHMHVRFPECKVLCCVALSTGLCAQLYKQHFAGEEDEDGEATADGEDDGKNGSNRNKRQVTRLSHK